MAIEKITDKNTLKSWFKRGLKPLEAQFHAWIDSFWHKSEKIPTSSIRGLEDTLNNKAETTAMNNLSTDLNEHKEESSLHKTTEEQGKLDNLADDPNMTYATKEELEASGAIIIPMDFTITDLGMEGEIKSFVQPFIDDGTFFTKPIYAHYTWKTDYTEGATDAARSIIVAGKPFSSDTTHGYEFNYPIDIAHIYDGETYVEKFRIAIYLLRGKLTVRIYDYVPDPYDKTFFVAENGDGFITSPDRDSAMGIYSIQWTNFYKALKEGYTPALYLKTDNTDVFVPASYHLAKNAEDENRYEGTIRIQYIRDNQIWIEDRKFQRDNNGGFAGQGSVMSETTIQKIPMTTGKAYSLCFNAAFEVQNAEILDEFTKDHTAGNNPRLLISVNNMLFFYPNSLIASSTLVSAMYNLNSCKSHSHDKIMDIFVICEYRLDAKKSNEVWNVKLIQESLSLDDWDYLRASNIHVVSEYPTDLSTYADGSIFIRQEVAS